MASSLGRASGRSQEKRLSNFTEKTVDFAEISEANFAENRPISREFSGQVPLERDRFCTDFRNVFNETRRSQSIYSGFVPQNEIICFFFIIIIKNSRVPLRYLLFRLLH